MTQGILLFLGMATAMSIWKQATKLWFYLCMALAALALTLHNPNSETAHWLTQSAIDSIRALPHAWAELGTPSGDTLPKTSIGKTALANRSNAERFEVDP